MKVLVRVKKISENAKMPVYSTSDAAGFDFYTIESKELDPQETYIFKTGLKMEIPSGYEIQVRPRSGLSAKTGLRLANAPGTIDADYRGEVGIIITNTSYKNVLVQAGDRIAQGVLAQVPQADFQEVSELTETERGLNGFGSTGTK